MNTEERGREEYRGKRGREEYRGEGWRGIQRRGVEGLGRGEEMNKEERGGEEDRLEETRTKREG